MTMKKTLAIIVTSIFISAFANGQNTKGGSNLLMMKGERFKDGASVQLNCEGRCCVVYKDEQYITFTMDGKVGDRSVNVIAEIPILEGIKKIKLDKDGDLGNHQKFTIEVFGKNPAVDKETYEIQDEADEAIFNLMHIDENRNIVDGTVSVKYFDSATDSRKLSATLHFFIPLN